MKMLTQADSRKLINTGEYYKQKFKVFSEWRFVGGRAGDPEVDWPLKCVKVNGIKTPIKHGKKPCTFAIRETLEMCGARKCESTN